MIKWYLNLHHVDKKRVNWRIGLFLIFFIGLSILLFGYSINWDKLFWVLFVPIEAGLIVFTAISAEKTSGLSKMPFYYSKAHKSGEYHIVRRKTVFDRWESYMKCQSVDDLIKQYQGYEDNFELL